MARAVREEDATRTPKETAPKKPTDTEPKMVDPKAEKEREKLMRELDKAIERKISEDHRTPEQKVKAELAAKNAEIRQLKKKIREYRTFIKLYFEPAELEESVTTYIKY